ncbi:hypothetical protein DXG03_004810 [Asterophora parasitica]|uniref:FAD/NAD(P)-binding domain-containing protein n=1 Tax=Asterophora parasitica TaxID=117018 RepID=A0A9P7KA35_9AGAR|nr:hypothetical protein DXG03_004810 [Asterophora parasitica]
MVTSAPIPNTPLPTLDNLKASVPDDLDAKAVTNAWFAAFANSAESGDAQSAAALFVPDAFWRDFLALTWDFRTFSGAAKITEFLNDCLGSVHPRAFVLREDTYLGLQQPYPDLAWIHLMFDFETDVGIASGIARIVPTANGDWKAHTVFTNLEQLKGFPEKIGALRDYAPNHGKWVEDRKKEAEFADTQPTVLIVGGGQSGLAVAARLKALDIKSLVVEKNARIGDNWRNRYDTLSLHNPVWYDHLPYLPFPSTWPVYAPSGKVRNNGAILYVTMYQRSSTYIMTTKNGWKVFMGGLYSEDGPPTDIADRLSASFPIHMGIGLSQRKVKETAELDKDLLDGLRSRGFLLNDGIHGTGFGLLSWSRYGGFYLDTGASSLIADGKIKLKSGSAIKQFTERGLEFEDGTILDADTVIFATGLGDSRSHVGKVCGEEVEKRLKPLWGLDAEGEINGAWRDLGVKGIWSMLGNLALSRFHSKHVALQIKAIEEGVFGERYSLAA